MPSPNAIAPPPSPAHFELLTVNFRLFCSKPFSFTHFRKNASATPLVSHTFKTKDLKPFRFIHFQKKVGGCPSDFQLQTSNLQSAILRAETEPWILEKSSASLFEPSCATRCSPR